MNIRVLHIENDPDDTFLVHHYVNRMTPDGIAYHLTKADDLRGGLEHLKVEKTDVVLLDLDLPDSSGLDTLRSVLAAAPEVPVIVLSGNGDRHMDIEAVRLGAEDYVRKDQMNATALVRTIRYALQRRQKDSSGVSPDARLHAVLNALTSILGLAQLALRSQNLDAQTKSDLESICVEAKRCAQNLESQCTAG